MRPDTLPYFLTLRCQSSFIAHKNFMPLPKSSAEFAMPSQQSGSRLSRRSVMALGALGAAAGLAGYAFGVEPRWVSVEHHEMVVPDLPKHLLGKTLVHLSDVHVGKRVDAEYLQRQFDYVSSLQPDFVCFTGDFICLLYTSPSPRDATLSRMPSSA